MASSGVTHPGEWTTTVLAHEGSQAVSRTMRSGPVQGAVDCRWRSRTRRVQRPVPEARLGLAALGRPGLGGVPGEVFGTGSPWLGR